MSAKRVLVIDDDPLFGQLLAGKGNQRDLSVSYVPTLIDAVFGHDLREFDAVVVDCLMPEMDGAELVQYFKTFHHGMPIILVSRSLDQTTSAMWRQSGASAFVAKRRGLGAILDTVQAIA